MLPIVTLINFSKLVGIPLILLLPNCLLISSSYQTTHTIPIIDGRVILDKSRRINIGGYHSNELLTKTLHLKYSDYKSKFTNELIQEIQEKYTMCAKDYNKQLKLLENVFKHDQDKLQKEEKIRMFGSLEMYEKAYADEIKSNKIIVSKYKHLKAYKNMIEYNNELLQDDEEQLIRDLIFFEWPKNSNDIVMTDEEMRKKHRLK